VSDYSLGDAARILKVSPRRLRYWQKTRLLDSLAQETAEEGVAFRDLVCLRTIVSLLDKGIPLQRIRRNLEILRTRLPEMDDPAAALRLWDEDSHRLVVRNDGRLEEPGGQLLLEFEVAAAEAEGRVSSLAEAAGGGASPAATADEALAWFERGCELDIEASGWDAAIEAYEKALELEPDYADAY
jgi:DNA-binding transcriptional MerR regulator